MNDAEQKLSEHDWPMCEVDGCGHDLEFEDCWSCGGEGGEFPYESFPLEYLPDEWESCLECSGRGTISWCPTHGRIDNEWESWKGEGMNRPVRTTNVLSKGGAAVSFPLSESDAWIIENALYQYQEWAEEATADDPAYQEDADGAAALRKRLDFVMESYRASKPPKRTARVSRELLADPLNCICPQDTNGTDPSCPVHAR